MEMCVCVCTKLLRTLQSLLSLELCEASPVSEGKDQNVCMCVYMCVQSP